jgi:LuxR family maltose regulon positive regulatory protein
MPGTTGRITAHRRRHAAGAGDAVLASKITVPAAPEWIVPRDRIEKLIATGARGPLTVITGPPGAGKTVALAAWAAARPSAGPIAWVTLDRFDNRPDVFWSYVVEALRRAGVPLPSDLPASPARQPDLFLHQVSSALAIYEETITLVLDDVHMLTDPRSLDGISYVLRNASEGLRLLVASRMDPLLPLHRYRLTGELTEIRADDLAFTEQEAKQLMAQHGVTLPPEWLKTLTRRHEGWAAGLRLAAISLDGHPNPELFIKELDAEDGAIAGYLVDEVLNSQPRQVRDLLLKTSILDRVTVGLAAEVTGNEEAAEAIPGLAHANAFVEPMGYGWYRYHSLFADVLRLKLRHQSPGEVPELRRRAARWLRRNGTLREALRQAVAAGDWALAARIAVDEFALGAFLPGQAETSLADDFKQLPPGTQTGEPRLDEGPLLAVRAAMALRSGQQQACGAWLARARDVLARLPADQEVPARLASALTRAALARRTGDFDGAAAAATDAAGQLGGLGPDVPARYPEVHAQVLAARGAVELWAGRFDDAAELLEQAGGVTRDAGTWAGCVGLRAVLEAVRGRLNQAAALAGTASVPPWHRRPRTAWQPRAAAEVAHAWVHLERNQLGEAGAALSRADDALRGQPDRLLGALAWLVAARHSLARGRTETAAEMLGRAGRGWSPPAWLAQRLALARSQACAAAGDIRTALAAAGQTGPPASFRAAVALAHVHLAADDPGAAARALAGASGAREAPEYVQLEARLAEAEAGYASGHTERARQSLTRALKLAGGERFLLPFALQRAWIEPALRHDPGLAENLRRLFEPGAPGPSGPQPQPAATQPAAPVIVEQLSGRELEVLRLVSKMLTTAEIADEMYLSVNTVKSHLKSIFRKLGTSHRGEAVRLAQRLALLLATLPAACLAGPAPARAALQDATFLCPPDGVVPAGDAELAVDGAGVALDGVRRHVEFLADLPQRQ